MQNIKIFNNAEIGQVRTITKNNEIWFIGKDIANILKYTDTDYAIRTHVDEEDKKLFKPEEISGLKIPNRGMVFINESGFYSLAFSSKLPIAKKFRRWVKNEVLPSIRKYGIYATSQTIDNMLADPDNAIKVFSTLEEERQQRIALEQENKEQTKVIEAMKPIKQYYDDVLTAKSAINITQIAKQYGLSGKKLNEILNQEKIIYKSNGAWVLYQKYEGKGLVKYHTEPIETEYGTTITKTRIKWTEKGRRMIHDIMRKLGYRTNQEKDI